MNPIAASLITGALVVGGKLAEGKSPTIENGLGVAGIAVGLAVLNEMNTELASAFGVLIVVSVAIVHFPVIVKATGLGEKSKK